jgi:hypothetical protein
VLFGRDTVLSGESGNWMALELASGADPGTVVCPGTGTRTGAGPQAVTVSAPQIHKTASRIDVFNDALLVSWSRRLIGSSRAADGLWGLRSRSAATDGSRSRLGDIWRNGTVDQTGYL